MFFITYLRRELSRRMRQGVVIALGLAVGVGLVATVSAASTVTGAVVGPPGPEICTNGRCVNAAGQTQANLSSTYLGISASKVAEAARLPGVAAAARGIMLLDQTITFPKNGGLGQPGSSASRRAAARPASTSRWRGPRPCRCWTATCGAT